MKCQEINKLMFFYVEGSVSADYKRQIEQHLASCAGCASRLDYLRSTLDVIDTEKATEVNPFLYTRIKAKLAQTEPTKIRASYYLLKPIRIAAIIILGIVLGIWVGGLVQPEQTDFLAISEETEFYLNDMIYEPIELTLLNDE